MNLVRFGRAVQLVTTKADSDGFKVGLESIESGTGRLLDLSVDYSGEGIDFQPGDVLFGKLRPYLAKTWLADRPGSAVGDFHVFRALGGRLHPQFLKYVTLSRGFLDPVVSSVYGSKMPRANWDFIRDVEIWQPPLGEQRAIADFLDRETAKVDTLILKQRTLIGTLKPRATATVDALTTGLDGPQVRLKFLFAQSLEASSPGDEVLSVFRDYGVVRKSSREGNFNRTPEDLSRYLAVRPGDLVVNKMKAWQGSLGISTHSGIVSGDYEVARPTSTHLDSAFAHTVLRSPRMVSEFARRSTGIRPSQWRLYWNQLGDVRVPLPQLEVQRRVARDVDQQLAEIDMLAAKAESLIALAKERRAALITAAVTGGVSPRA